MKTLQTFLLSILLQTCLGQGYASFTKTINSLYNAAAIADSVQRKNEIQKVWSDMHTHGIPYVIEDSVAFLYQGDARTVAWMGDFNGWGYKKDFDNKGTRINGTHIWILKSSFPRDSRLDYKLLLNGSNWLLDTENPFQQWSGVGGGSANSELRMPGWKEDDILKERDGIAHGEVVKDVLFSSKVLGYQVNYSVYLPAGYKSMGKLPVAYLTDGYEYMLPELGNIITVLDNLIADKKIDPIVAVLIDHREPINRSNNRRMEELNMNEKYLKFFTDEFLPAVEKKYPIQQDAAHRAIIGTSMGGLTSAYFAFTRPDLFGMAGIQSPAFWTRPQIYSVCDNPNGAKVKVSLTSGVMNDASEGSRKLRAILENNACIYTYRENNEGHSWGNWRNLEDDILTDLFGKH